MRKSCFSTVFFGSLLDSCIARKDKQEMRRDTLQRTLSFMAGWRTFIRRVHEVLVKTELIMVRRRRRRDDNESDKLMIGMVTVVMVGDVVY